VIWKKRQQVTVLLEIELSGFNVNAHFFVENEIEIDIRPEDVVPGGFQTFALVGRLRPGVTASDLVRELSPLAQRLPERFGGPPGYADLIRKHRPVVRPLEEQLVGNVARPLWLLFGSVAVVRPCTFAFFMASAIGATLVLPNAKFELM